MADKTQERELSEELQQSYIDYAMSVIVSRALPDVRDGLKPVQRRILYTMYEDRLFPNSSFKKSATVVGNTLARYHPHGDSSVYGALVRLAQPFSLRYPLVQGQGNFGSLDDPGEFAAMRYTEAKLSPIGLELLRDIEKNTVPFVPNYDGSRQEPQVLPSPLPNLLLNGAVGIAVGLATNIPPHNLREVLEAIIFLIDNPQASIEELLEIIKGPDFPTGGIIFDKKALLTAYATGKGAVIVRGKAEIEERKGREIIVIKEIPFGVSKAQLLTQIAKIAQEKKALKISELRDESDREGMRIVVELQKGASAHRVLNHLYQHTLLQTKFHFNLIALVDGISPKLLNLKELLTLFLEHRKEVIYKRTSFELEQAKARVHILEGLVKALQDIDKVIEIIKRSSSREKARSALQRAFELTEKQAEAILDMRLGSLAKLERERIKKEERDLKLKIKELQGILRSEKKILQIIKTELKEYIERFGDERRTLVIPTPPEKIGWEDMVPEEDTLLLLTKKGLIKRVNPSSWRTQKRGGKGSRVSQTAEDEVQLALLCSTHDLVLIFTSEGRVFGKRGFEFPTGDRNSKGKNILNFLELRPTEKVVEMIRVRKGKEREGSLFFVTKKGYIKKTELALFSEASLGRGLRALILEKEDGLVKVLFLEGKEDVLLFTAMGKSIRFSVSSLREMGRQAKGVKGINLQEGDEVVSADKSKDQKGYVLLVSKKGYAKLTALREFKKQKRGGKGIIAMRITEKTGPVLGAKCVKEVEGECLLVSALGQMIKIPLSSIKKMGRATQGVRVMKLKEGDELVSFSVVK